eukprot:XP_011681240.1 PREDICTED: ribonuclease T2-like [Strongylocentrotus purpuratus]
MARISILILLVALCCMNTIEGRSFRELFRQVFEEVEYDKLVLVNTWGPSFCEKENCEIISTYKKNWTIHGLWPFKSNMKNTPIDCTGEFINDEINDIRNEMNLKWPSYKKGGSKINFWYVCYRTEGLTPNLGSSRPVE